MSRRTYTPEKGIEQFINIWVEDAIHKADAWAFIRVLIWELYMDFPETTLKWSCETMISHEAFLRGIV